MSILSESVLNRLKSIKKQESISDMKNEKSVSNSPSTNRAVIPHIQQRQWDERFSIDTVKFRFICNQEKFDEYTKFIDTEIRKKDRDNDLEDYSIRYIGINIYNQNFEAFYDDIQRNYRVLIEFSLPKLFHLTNLSKCGPSELWDYYECCVKPYALSPKTTFLNRFDNSINYSFHNNKDLNTFEKFLRTHKLGNKDMESSKDYCFWKMTERVVRFYKKFEEIRDNDKIRLTDFNTVNDYLDARAKNYSYLRFASDNNIGRLEFEYKRDWIEQKFGSNQFEKIFTSLVSYNWMGQFEKDFPFIEKGSFEVKDMERIEYVIFELKKHQKTRDYLEFLLLAKSHSLEYAEEKFKVLKGKNYSRFISRFFDITGFTIEQALQDITVCVNFPDKVLYYTSEYYQVPEEYAYLDFKKLENNLRKSKLQKEKIRKRKAMKRYAFSGN